MERRDARGEGRSGEEKETKSWTKIEEGKYLAIACTSHPEKKLLVPCWQIEFLVCSAGLVTAIFSMASTAWLRTTYNVSKVFQVIWYLYSS
jgi:hypothetical protein